MVGDAWPDDVVEEISRRGFISTWARYDRWVIERRSDAAGLKQSLMQNMRCALRACEPWIQGRIAEAEAAAYERAARSVEELTRKHGNPNGNDYAQGTWDHGLFQCAPAIRALKPEGGDGE
jgi:hypothetical protein